MLRRTNRASDEKGFSAMEVIIGAIIISVIVSVCGFIVNWISEGMKERRANNPLLNKQNESVEEVKPGKEFGSVVITFNL